MTVESQETSEEKTEIDVTETGSLIAYNETKRGFQQERILFSPVKNRKLWKSWCPLKCSSSFLFNDTFSWFNRKKTVKYNFAYINFYWFLFWSCRTRFPAIIKYCLFWTWTSSVMCDNKLQISVILVPSSLKMLGNYLGQQRQHSGPVKTITQ